MDAIDLTRIADPRLVKMNGMALAGCEYAKCRANTEYINSSGYGRGRHKFA
ncbi:hypothetical protein [Bradyrhizobium sp. AS23.2]|uniref:hypothetical protein n=1 Tax=Bradyrhizobium sp. AS23.2 TaxID=1680155 RepID=UPI001431E632|nr:hypothetical protein [Bradyrhizobium sp. AS23.2]